MEILFPYRSLSALYINDHKVNSEYIKRVTKLYVLHLYTLYIFDTPAHEISCAHICLHRLSVSKVTSNFFQLLLRYAIRGAPLARLLRY